MTESENFDTRNTVCVEVLAKNLDPTIQKVGQLVELLEKANSLVRELASAGVVFEVKL